MIDEYTVFKDFFAYFALKSNVPLKITFSSYFFRNQNLKYMIVQIYDCCKNLTPVVIDYALKS